MKPTSDADSAVDAELAQLQAALAVSETERQALQQQMNVQTTASAAPQMSGELKHFHFAKVGALFD